MNVSASVYSWTGIPIQNVVRLLDSCYVDYLHFDCVDNPLVFHDIALVRQESATPIDLHLVAKAPERYFDLVLRHGIESVSFQIDDAPSGFIAPIGLSARIGLAVRSSNFNVSTFARYSHSASFVMFTATTPGRSGGRFDPRTLNAIARFRRKFPEKDIHVDGGINGTIASSLRSMGVACVVTGSYLSTSVFPGDALISLKLERAGATSPAAAQASEPISAPASLGDA